MSSWRLPTRLEVGGKAYPIHSDYRDILDILHRLNDASEPEFIRWRVALALFYEGDLPRSDYPEAMQKLADFLKPARHFSFFSRAFSFLADFCAGLKKCFHFIEYCDIMQRTNKMPHKRRQNHEVFY